jgi:transcriptional regulator with XRE-family HTH domain
MAKKKREAGLVEQLRTAIRDSGLTLTELSERAGVALPMLTRFVRKERGLNLATAEKVCDALHLRLAADEGEDAGGKGKTGG